MWNINAIIWTLLWFTGLPQIKIIWRAGFCPFWRIQMLTAFKISEITFAALTSFHWLEQTKICLIQKTKEEKGELNLQTEDDEGKLSHFNSSLISSLLVPAFKGQIFFDPRLLWKLDRGFAVFLQRVFLKSILINFFHEALS